MKKYMFFGLAFLFIALSAYAQNLPSVRIINNTGYTVYYLYISESSSEDWEEDVLDGDYINIEFTIEDLD